VFVQGGELRRDPCEPATRAWRVLREDDVNGAERGDRALRDVAQITDRRGYSPYNLPRPASPCFPPSTSGPRRSRAVGLALLAASAAFSCASQRPATPAGRSPGDPDAGRDARAEARAD
jgi:hypothetical protein